MPVEKRKTIVIGHKNPDTDSICSAICYANLKTSITERSMCHAGQDVSMKRLSLS